MKIITILLMVVLCSCNNNAQNNTTNMADSPYKSIDSSAIINNSSIIADSTNVGVQH